MPLIPVPFKMTPEGGLNVRADLPFREQDVKVVPPDWTDAILQKFLNEDETLEVVGIDEQPDPLDPKTSPLRSPVDVGRKAY